MVGGFIMNTEGRDLCGMYEKLLKDLSVIVETRGYLDKRGVLTSEGRAYLMSVIRYMVSNRLRCIETVRELMERFSKIESVYECLRDALDSCRNE